MEEEKREEPTEEKTEAHKPQTDITHKIRANPFILSTLVLGVLAVVLLIVVASGNSITGNVISKTQAGEVLANFAESQGTDIEVTNIEKENGFYKVLYSTEQGSSSVYVTLDGKNLINGMIPITSSQDDSDNSASANEVDVPKADVPVVELFVMSYCPYGTQAEKGIIPVVELLGDKIDFTLRFVDYAMHPTSGEVEENLREYCIQKEQEDKFMDYLACFLKEGDSDGCLIETGVDTEMMNSCYDSANKEFSIIENLEDKSSWLNGRYPMFNTDKDLNDEYGVRGSPTLVINGEQVSSSRDPASYLDVVCQAFTDGNVPEECGTELSTAQYSPGFGYDVSSGDTTASCD